MSRLFIFFAEIFANSSTMRMDAVGRPLSRRHHPVSIAVMVLLPTTFTITIITKMPSTRNKGVSTREETLHDNVTDNNNSER